MRKILYAACQTDSPDHPCSRSKRISQKFDSWVSGVAVVAGPARSRPPLRVMTSRFRLTGSGKPVLPEVSAGMEFSGKNCSGVPAFSGAVGSAESVGKTLPETLRLRVT